MAVKINLEKIKIRKLVPADLKRAKEFQEYINSLIKENVMINLNKKRTLKEEREWLKDKLKKIKKKRVVLLIAEDNKKIVGISKVKLMPEKQSHVAEFGISIRKGYRGIGLGKKLMREILKLAKKELKPKMIRLSVFSENKIAQNLYRKFSFKEVARIPQQIKHKGKLIDEIIMIKK